MMSVVPSQWLINRECHDASSMHDDKGLWFCSGVGFRYFTQQAALRLGLTGYVRNLADGSVEALACGEREQIMKLITCLEAGEYAMRKWIRSASNPVARRQGGKHFLFITKYILLA